MSRLYEEHMAERQQKQEALLDVPEQMQNAFVRLDEIADSLSETLSRFEPVRLCDIFLSHKSADKAMVLRVKNVLSAAGYKPWIDEEQMPAGTSIDRGILAGMNGSCAAVFFLSPQFEDSQFISQEIDYAIKAHRDRPKQFAIIPILVGDAADSIVPDLLQRFVIKRADSEMDVLFHILQALPIRLGPPIERDIQNAT